MTGYQYDVFISYCRYGSAQKWLLNNFYPKFTECLTDQLRTAPAVYIDRKMRRGVHWPSDLVNAVQRSKIMIPVLTPRYFESRWCMSEWRTMRTREEMLGLVNVDRPQGLIWPILYSDSDNFPPEGRERAWSNFKKCAMPEKVYQDSRGWRKFHKRVVELAEELAARLAHVPPWQPDWPVVNEPDPPLLPPPSLPRFE